MLIHHQSSQSQDNDLYTYMFDLYGHNLGKEKHHSKYMKEVYQNLFLLIDHQLQDIS